MTGLLGQLFRKKSKQDIACCAVVPAAGRSTRMNGQDKLFLPLWDEPVLAHTLCQLEKCPLITEIIVATREDCLVEIADLCKEYSFTKVSKIIVGGDSRLQSVYAGVCEVPSKAKLIAIHDGARPLVTQQVLEEVILRAAESGAAAPAVGVKDTVKRAEKGTVLETLDRSQLYAVQTPQVFEAALIRGALFKALEDGVALTDDCAAVERLGMKVVLTQGSEENIKITTPADLLMASAILEGRDKD